MNIWRLATSYDTLLQDLAVAATERERIMADAGKVNLKALQDVNRTIRYCIDRLRIDDKRLKSYLSAGFFRTGDIIKLLDQDKSEQSALLRHYVVVFQEVIPDITPMIRRLARLLKRQCELTQADATVQLKIESIEEHLQKDLSKLRELIFTRYSNQFVTLSHNASPNTPAAKYLSQKKASFWVLVQIVAVMSVYLNNVRLLVGVVKGTHPVSGEVRFSRIYSRITAQTVDEIFQTDVSWKFWANIRGAKAIVYRSDDGQYHVAFMTEAIMTHHRHAAALIAHLKDAPEHDYRYVLDVKADALYEGNPEVAAAILRRCAGYELQYDTRVKNVVGIKQDSWITKQQLHCGLLPQQVQEDMLLALLEHIDPEFLSDRYRELSDETIAQLVLSGTSGSR